MFGRSSPHYRANSYFSRNSVLKKYVFADDFAEMTPPVSKKQKSENKLSKSRKDKKNSASSASKNSDKGPTSKTRRGTER